MRPTAAVLLLSLATLLAAIASAGVGAMSAFRSLPQMGITVAGTEEFFEGRTEDMGRYAAGRLMQPVFLTSDRVQFAFSALAVGCTVRLARLGGLRGAAWARWLLMACVAVGAAALAVRAAISPGMNADLLAYWDAVAAGERMLAAEAMARFDAGHRLADALYKVQLFAVLGALATFVLALVPAPAAAHGATSGRSA